ncbi:hypothetical protein, partial, partial [Parasitella parasitica]
MSVIKDGFQLLFHTTPTTTTQGSTFSVDHQQHLLLTTEVRQLIAKGALEEVPRDQQIAEPGFYRPMFVIPKKSGGHRPVFNLKRLNQFLEPRLFKMETLAEITRLIAPNDCMCSIDLTDAFLHIKVHRAHRRFLRMVFDGKAYQMRTLSLGCSLSPWVFTKVCRPTIHFFRQQGNRLAAYLDDWLIVGSLAEETRQHTQRVVRLVQNLGWLINLKKAQLEACQQIDHLGFSLDSQTMQAA